MSNKKLSLIGVTLLVLPVVLLYVDKKLLGCNGDFLFLPQLLWGIDSILDYTPHFLIVSVPTGLILLLYVFWRWDRTRTTSLARALIDMCGVILLLLIIGSVILASLNSPRHKGGDAAVKSMVNNSRAQAELHYDKNMHSYDGFCDDVKMREIQKAIGLVKSEKGALCSIEPASIVCKSSQTEYVFSAELPATPHMYFCADSTGFARIIDHQVEHMNCQK